MRRMLIIFISVCMYFQINAKTITVCKSCNINSLAKALSIAQTNDSIIIKKGVYYEPDIVINKSLKIIGENDVVIDGKNMNGIIIDHTNNFVIKNVHIQNIKVSYIKDNAALKITKCDSFLIENVTITNTFFGIHLEKSTNGIIRNNIVSSIKRTNEAGTGNGIHAWHCSNIDIYNNEIFNMRDGIYFEFVDKSNIYNNYSHDNIRYGLHYMFSNNDVYYNNTFKSNGAGVAVMFSKYIEMHHNKFVNNWGAASYGLLLKEITDTKIYKNVFEENTTAINIEGTNRVNYENNIFRNNGWSLKIDGACYTNTFVKNDFLNNSLDVSYNSRINDNIFNKNYWSDYAGYDLDKNGVGDVPYRPVKLFSYIVNEIPQALVLLRSLFIDIINFSEKVSPIFTPDNVIDEQPVLNPINDFDSASQQKV